MVTTSMQNQEPSEIKSDFSHVQFTLEQQVAYEMFSRQVDRMSIDQAKEFLRYLYKHIQYKDSTFKQLFKSVSRHPSDTQSAIDDLTNNPIAW